MALRRNILIFHMGAAGDFIVTWPLAITLARLFPQSRVYYVTHSQKGILAEKVLRTEWTDVEGGWHQLFAEAGVLPEPAARLLAGAHTIVSFVADAAGVWEKSVRAAAPEAQLALLSTAVPDNFAGHVIEYILGQLKGWRAAETSARQILRSIAERGIACARPGGGPVVIHPGSGSAKKCWSIECFIELARRLKAQGREVGFLIGETEREKWPATRLAALSEAAAIIEPAGTLELLDSLTRAPLFIGNDSGPGHLAGIIGVPTVSIFGPGNPARWSPLGPRVRVVAGALDEIKVEHVLQAIEVAQGT